MKSQGARQKLIRSTALLMTFSLLAACGKSDSTTASTPTRPGLPIVPPPPHSNNYNPQYPIPAPIWDAEPINDDSDFDPYNAFDEDMGDWIMVGHQRFFRPYILVMDWQPYQNGYWSYDIDFGWTWVSYDRWGFVTDHYGVWRFHGVYGWIWMPFPQGHRHYRPHCVTWFDDDREGDFVGWYPYYNDFPDAYRMGYEDGFRDGFWMGFQATEKLNRNNNNFFLGITVVQRRDVTVVNVRERKVQDDVAVRVAFDAHAKRRIRGDIPGGNREKAYGFLQISNDPDRLAPIGRSRKDKIRGGDAGQILVAPEDTRRIRVKELREKQHDQQKRDAQEVRRKKHKKIEQPILDESDSKTILPVPPVPQGKHRKFANPDIDETQTPSPLELKKKKKDKKNKKKNTDTGLEDNGLRPIPDPISESLEEPKIQIKPKDRGDQNDPVIDDSSARHEKRKKLKRPQGNESLEISEDSEQE